MPRINKIRNEKICEIIKVEDSIVYIIKEENFRVDNTESKAEPG